VNGVGDAFAEIGDQVAAAFLPERVGNGGLEIETDSVPTVDRTSSESVSLGVGVTSVITGVVFVPPKVASQLAANALAVPCGT
jgi:hypothetical protein